jgi:hypothetical protein
MIKKNLANVTTDLSALAAMMPTQRAAVASAIAVEAQPMETIAPPIAVTEKNETLTQFSLSLRKELRKQLGRLAADADMTMRAFVLDALREKGLSVRDDDIVDLRKERH